MLDLALRALAEPRRREILGLIQHTERPAGEIASHFDVTRPAISQHLQVLVRSGLVTVRRDRTSMLYRARPEGMRQVLEFLDQFWGDGLLRLKEAAEAEERRTDVGPE